MKHVVVLLAVILAGCVSTGVKELDDNHFMISKQDWMAYTGGQVKVEIFKEARDFCAAKGKKMKLIGQQSQDYAIGASAGAELQFSCE
jgi:hypothetical protein